MVGQHQRRLYRTGHITGECNSSGYGQETLTKHRLQHGLPAPVFIVAKALSQVSHRTTSTVNFDGVSGQIGRTGKAYFVTSLVRTLSTTTAAAAAVQCGAESSHPVTTETYREKTAHSVQSATQATTEAQPMPACLFCQSFDLGILDPSYSHTAVPHDRH